jgi:hypothetical protein
MENKKKKLVKYADIMEYMNSRPNSLGQKNRQIPNDETSAEKPSVKKTEIEVMFFSPGLMETMRAAFIQHQKKKKDDGRQG